MIRIKLKQKMDDVHFETGHRVTIADIAKKTELSRSTLNRVINTKGYNVGLDAIDQLCDFFDCQPGDLLEYYPDAEK